ncbi:hypothetical protein MSI_18870 [Treponema sp. JC4]|uniref:hypothetical protein n=1 Tax=Treponema sp. JC4 TaxID=1124982 RepID=UPI00025B0C82|nr:hypothetical protein [Treponema sp. JC4]EID84597.1 hypothetical protein MSI_18870 [Treponema sp. JC4]
MKKNKILISMLVFLLAIAFSGCNMELRSSLGDELETFTEQKLTSGTIDISDSVSVIGTVQKSACNENSTFYCSGFKAGDGVAVSFNMLNTYDSDWTDVLKTVQTVIRLSTMDYKPDGTYKDNIYEAAASVGVDFPDYSTAAYQIYYNKACFVTISFNTDGSICFYQNGKLALTYAASTTFNGGSVKVEDENAVFISDITAGETMTTGIQMKNLYITQALNDTNAALLYSYDAAQD